VPQLRAGDPYKVDQRLFWHVVDELDYLLALLRLRILDALAGPLYRRRRPISITARDRERLERAFPG
jgi:hypothetical protein